MQILNLHRKKCTKLGMHPWVRRECGTSYGTGIPKGASLISYTSYKYGTTMSDVNTSNFMTYRPNGYDYGASLSEARKLEVRNRVSLS
jgi:hypothetical protein